MSEGLNERRVQALLNKAGESARAMAEHAIAMSKFYNLPDVMAMHRKYAEVLLAEITETLAKVLKDVVEDEAGIKS